MDEIKDYLYKHQEALSRLNGARLTSVQFILDYLNLGFDEKGALTTFVWPEIFDRRETKTFEMSGYKDKLCLLINDIAQHVTFDINETINIDFKKGLRLCIPLRTYKLPGERAILTGPNHYIYVF